MNIHFTLENIENILYKNTGKEKVVINSFMTEFTSAALLPFSMVFYIAGILLHIISKFCHI